MKILYPLKNQHKIFNGFGPRESFYIPELGDWTLPFHYGVDFAASEGTPIYSVAAGVVVFNAWDSTPYGGGYMIGIQSGAYTHWYLHRRKKTSHALGQKIRAGQKIGEVGNTGASTGPHLHFEQHLFNEPINPESNFVKKLPNPTKETKPMKTIAYNLKKPLVIKPGALKRIPINDRGNITLDVNSPQMIVATVYAKGRENDDIQTLILTDTWDTKLKKTVKSSVRNRDTRRFSRKGLARATVTKKLAPKKNVRIRVAVRNESTQDITVTRILVEGLAT